MQKNTNQLGDILKGARIKQKLTRDQLSEKVHITTRYLMSIENENKKPSYDVLFRLIRELEISADQIFYPEDETLMTELNQASLLLRRCNRYELHVVMATARALLEKK
jgi:transcriptional regulator with XRE-family HTH domain